MIMTINNNNNNNNNDEFMILVIPIMYKIVIPSDFNTFGMTFLKTNRI
jgi:hypothetical protein